MTRSSVDPYRDWDAAYVLGALAPAERQEFEQHLAECAECSSAVAELAGLPGILGKLPPEEAETVGAAVGRVAGAAHDTGAVAATPSPAHAPATPDSLRRLSTRVRHHRLRSRVLAGAIAAAACAASVAVTLAATGADAGAGEAQAGATRLHFSPVVATSLTATGTLVPEPWGTRIEWSCAYAATTPATVAPTVAPTIGPTKEPAEGGITANGRYPTTMVGAHDYALLVEDEHGAITQVATWFAAPGSVVTPTATTSIPAADIRSVEIRSTGTGRTLLSAAG